MVFGQQARSDGSSSLRDGGSGGTTDVVARGDGEAMLSFDVAGGPLGGCVVKVDVRIDLHRRIRAVEVVLFGRRGGDGSQRLLTLEAERRERGRDGVGRSG